MNKIIFDEKPTSLVFNRQGSYYVILDVQPEYTDEKKFKNSAFVKTGRKVPTGKYTGYELKICTGTQKMDVYIMKKKVLNAISEFISSKILSGFEWNNYKVWLSAENQQNYASWMTAAKANSNILPLEAKFNYGIRNSVVYYNFSTIEELEDFYSSMVKYINDTVSFGRKLKENFESNLYLYEESLS